MATLALACALLSLACSSGGGGGSSGTLGASSPPATTGTTSAVTFAWADASGPVHGYAVWVQRGPGSFTVEQEVPDAVVTLEGDPGSRVRIIVVPFDAEGRTGPSSASGPWSRFPDPEPDTDGGVLAASEQTAGASEQTLAAPLGGDAGLLAAADVGSATQAGGADADAADGTDADEDTLEASASLDGGLLWQSTDAFRVTSAALETLALFPRPWDAAQLAVIADLDGDGASDAVWTDDTGLLAFTRGDELATGTPTPVELAPLDAGERVIGAGDLDGDGRDELLVRRGDSADVWFTLPDGGVETAELGSVGEATLAGVGDFDGDGVEDVAWSHGDGGTTLWLMAAGGALTSVEVSLGADLEVVAVADLDGDGAAELATRNAAGELLLARPLLPALEATDVLDATSWRTVGAADLDGDGSDELALVSDGALRIASFPGDAATALDPASAWTLVALLP